jgi:uncharacterized protein YdhG (YjbR/CyaY superfamily)
MHSTATTIDQYIAGLPDERREAFSELFSTIRQNIDPKFTEAVGYGMPGWDISKTEYPPGYHVNPALPVPFLGVANQKHYIALYHLGLYADQDLLKWFVDEYEKTGEKLDMGKSCIRFKKMDKIPYQLIGELVTRMSLDEYLALYTANLPSNK